MTPDFSILKAIGVVGFVETLPANAAFLTDVDVVDCLSQVESSGHLLDVAKQSASTLSDFRQIYILCRNGELGLTRSLARKLESSDVVSATYELLPRLSLTSEGKSNPDQEGAPRLMVVVLGSGFEIFTEALRRAKVADYQENITPELLTWAQSYQDFSFLRFLVGISSARTDKRLDTVLGMDVLAAMLNEKWFRLRYLKRLLEKLEGEVLYFADRDKCREAVVNACLSQTPYRTQGGVPDKKREQVFEKELDIGNAFEQLKFLLDAELKLESHLEYFTQFKFITMWDMQQNPKMVMENVAMFLNEHVNGPVKQADDKWLEEMPHFSKSVQALKDKMAKLVELS